MSRFNNPRALPDLLPHANVSADVFPAAPPRSLLHEGFRPAAPASSQVFTMGSEARPNTAQSLCFFVVNAYLLSGAANDLIYHFTHGRAFISAACVILLPILFLGT